jgi:hypothetical protein
MERMALAFITPSRNTTYLYIELFAEGRVAGPMGRRTVVVNYSG